MLERYIAILVTVPGMHNSVSSLVDPARLLEIRERAEACARPRAAFTVAQSFADVSPAR